MLYLFFVSGADEVWDYGNGKGINHTDTSGGGKMIRIMVNKATLTSTALPHPPSKKTKTYIYIYVYIIYTKQKWPF